MNAPSDEFYSAFCHSGALVSDCEYCGRTFFGSHGDFEEGEFEKLQAKARKEPHKYIEVEGDSTRWFSFNGKQCVFDCPCGAAAQIEALLWGHRHDIAKFLIARGQEEFKEAKRDLAQLLGL